MIKISANLADLILQKRGLRHVLFWLLVLLLQTLSASSYYDGFGKAFNHKLITLFPQILASYCLVYYQVPKLIFKKKYLLFALSFIVTSYCFSALARVMIVHIVEDLYRTPPFSQESIWEILTDLNYLIKRYFFSVYTVAVGMLVAKLVMQNFEEKSKREQLEKKKIAAELNFFKAQIHPHFIFNTLNNLYALTIQKSDKAPETVIKLSEMLDYMLYQCNDRFVTIEKEFKLINNYIDLEKLRYGDRLSLTLVHEIDNVSTPISPLILISLIENSFKHGASGSLINPSIKIRLIVKDKMLEFSIFNTKNQTQQADKDGYKKGIGLKNTKSQLELIYPNKYDLEINEQDDSYTVKLKIDLSA